MVKVKFNKGVGNAFLNCVRCAAFHSTSTIKPIGFRVGGDSTVVSISDSVLEDMTTFIKNIALKKYKYCGADDLVCASAVCHSDLLLSDLLAGSGVTVDVDGVVLHSTANVPVEVIFRYSAGCYSADENATFIRKNGYEGFVPIASRHSAVKTFTFDVSEATDTEEIFEVRIESVDDSDELVLLKQATKFVDELCNSSKFNLVSD